MITRRRGQIFEVQLSVNGFPEWEPGGWNGVQVWEQTQLDPTGSKPCRGEGRGSRWLWWEQDCRAREELYYIKICIAKWDQKITAPNLDLTRMALRAHTSNSHELFLGKIKKKSILTHNVKESEKKIENPDPNSIRLPSLVGIHSVVFCVIVLAKQTNQQRNRRGKVFPWTRQVKTTVWHFWK